jgi:predicted Holliday junction resolvase-like endonuclease
MEIMTALQIVFIILLCFPVMYLAFFFIRQLNKQLAQNQRQQQMRKKDEQRTIYNNRRTGRSR